MKLSLLTTPIIFVIAAILTSCAGSSSTEQLLSAAGFKIKVPETAKQKAIFAELSSYKVQRGTHDGKIFYAYKDEKENVAFVGGEKEYQKYQELSVQRSIARDQVQAAQMNRSMSYGWYGAYHPTYRRYFY